MHRSVLDDEEADFTFAAAMNAVGLTHEPAELDEDVLSKMLARADALGLRINNYPPTEDDLRTVRWFLGIRSNEDVDYIQDPDTGRFGGSRPHGDSDEGGGGKAPSAASVNQSAKAGIAAGAKASKNKPLEGSKGHPGLISTASITSVKKPLGNSEQNYIRADVAQMRKAPEVFETNIGLFKDTKVYPLRASETKGDSDKLVRTVLDRMKSNLRWLYDTTPKTIRDRAALWYPGGRTIINKQVEKYGEKYGLTDVSAAAVYAALSPRKDWDQNVYVGDKLIEIYFTKQNAVWDQKMSDRAVALVKHSEEMGAKATAKGKTVRMAVPKALQAIRGKTLAQLDKLDVPDKEKAKLKGLWIRVYDEAHTIDKDGNESRPFHIILPEGKYGELKKNDDGSLATAAWSGNSDLGTAVAALEANGDRTKISSILSDRHKVRSFYNNLLDPYSANEDVTVDTHQIGAAWLMPYSGKSDAVAQSFKTWPLGSVGFAGAAGSSVSGIWGNYPVYADALRELAHELGVSPRALQSIVWTAKRERFKLLSDEQKSDIQSVWKDYQNNKATLKEAHARIDKIAPMPTPNWAA